MLNTILDILSLGVRYYIRTQIDKQAQQHLVNQANALTTHVDIKVKQECRRLMADAIKQNNLGVQNHEKP